MGLITLITVNCSTDIISLPFLRNHRTSSITWLSRDSQWRADQDGNLSSSFGNLIWVQQFVQISKFPNNITHERFANYSNNFLCGLLLAVRRMACLSLSEQRDAVVVAELPDKVIFRLQRKLNEFLIWRS